MRLRLDRLIKPELDYYRENCNFTDDEKEIFELLAKGKSIVEISDKQKISTRSVNRKIYCIKVKIEKVSGMYGEGN